MQSLKIKNFIILAMSILIFQCISFAQLKKLTAPNMHSSADIYLDSNGNRYSTLVTVGFNNDILNLPNGTINASINKIKLPTVQNLFNILSQRYGSFKIEKEIPSAVWGDTIRINKRTGKTVYIKDMSQIFNLKFSKLVPIDSIIQILDKLPDVKFAEGPLITYLTTAPNDPLYSSAEHWAFDRIQAEKAWDITTGVRFNINWY